MEGDPGQDFSSLAEAFVHGVHASRYRVTCLSQIYPSPLLSIKLSFTASHLLQVEAMLISLLVCGFQLSLVALGHANALNSKARSAFHGR